MIQIAESLAGQFDRLPPHSVEAEMCLLASMMLDKEMIGQIVQIVDRDAFYQADHQIIYDILLKLYEQNRPCDAIILREELIKRGLYEEVGGREYLAAILGTVPSAAACSVARSSLRMPNMACMTRCARDGSGSARTSSMPTGTTCQDRP